MERSIFSATFTLDSVAFIFHSNPDLNFTEATFLVTDSFLLQLDDTDCLFLGNFVASTATALLEVELQGSSNLLVTNTAYSVDLSISGFQLFSITTNGPYSGYLLIDSAQVEIDGEVAVNITGQGTFGVSAPLLNVTASGVQLSGEIQANIVAQGFPPFAVVGSQINSSILKPLWNITANSAQAATFSDTVLSDCYLVLTAPASGLEFSAITIFDAFLQLSRSSETRIEGALINNANLLLTGTCGFANCVAGYYANMSIDSSFVLLQTQANTGIAAKVEERLEVVNNGRMRILGTGFNSVLFSQTAVNATTNGYLFVQGTDVGATQAKMNILSSLFDIDSTSKVDLNGNRMEMQDSEFINHGELAFSSTVATGDKLTLNNVNITNTGSVNLAVLVNVDASELKLEINNCYFLDSSPSVIFNVTVMGSRSASAISMSSIFARFFTFYTQGTLQISESNIKATNNLYIEAGPQIVLVGATNIHALGSGYMNLVATIFSFADFIHPSKTGGTITIQTSMLTGNSLQFGSGSYQIFLYGALQLSGSLNAANQVLPYAVLLQLGSSLGSANSISTQGALRLQGDLIVATNVQLRSLIAVGVCSIQSDYFAIAGSIYLEAANLAVTSPRVDLDGDISSLLTGSITFTVADVMNCQSSSWTSDIINLNGQGFVNFISNISITTTQTFTTSNPLIGTAESITFSEGLTHFNHALSSNYTGIIAIASGDTLFFSAYPSASLETETSVYLLISESVNRLTSRGSAISTLGCVSIPIVLLDAATVYTYSFQSFPDACPNNHQMISTSFKPQGALLVIDAVAGVLPAAGFVELTVVTRQQDALVDPWDDDFFSNYPANALVRTFDGRPFYMLYSSSKISLRSNSPPVAENDSFSSLLGVELRILAPGVLANDLDSEFDALFAVLVSPVPGLTLNPDGELIYLPSSLGTFSVSYYAQDPFGASSNLATILISIGPPLPSSSPSISHTATPTPSFSFTSTPTSTPSPSTTSTPTPSPSTTPTPTPTPSPSPSPTSSPSTTSTSTFTPTPSTSSTSTSTFSSSPTPSTTSTSTATPSPTTSTSSTSTSTSSPTPSTSSTSTVTATSTPTPSTTSTHTTTTSTSTATPSPTPSTSTSTSTTSTYTVSPSITSAGTSTITATPSPSSPAPTTSTTISPGSPSATPSNSLTLHSLSSSSSRSSSPSPSKSPSPSTSESQAYLPTSTNSFNIQLASILPPQPGFASSSVSPSNLPSQSTFPSPSSAIVPSIIPLTTLPQSIKLNNSSIVLVTSNGESIVITIPNGLGENIVVNIVQTNSSDQIDSPVISITMFDAFGNEISRHNVAEYGFSHHCYCGGICCFGNS